MKKERPDKAEIDELKEELIKFYSTLRANQKEVQGYIDDEFITSIKSPYREVRTGSGPRMIETYTQHITTSNPHVFWEPRRSTDKAQDSARRVSIMLNNWAKILVDQIEEASKNQASRGEGFFQIDFNPDWPDDTMPIRISSPDPMIINAYPGEVNGIPPKVIKFCKMSVGQVKSLYPNFTSDRKTTELVDYLAYFDRDWRYFEADGTPLLPQGMQRNIFGFVPLVHFYSQYGKDSPEGKPESKAVSMLWKARGTLRQQCEEESRIDSTFALYTNPIVVLKANVDGMEITEEDKRSVNLSPGATVGIPFGWDYEIRQGDPPSPEMFHHVALLNARLGLDMPPVSQGIPSTSQDTGRLADIQGSHYGTRFKKSVHNLERALATTLGLCLRIIDTVPAVLPIDIDTLEFQDGKYIRKSETVTKEDIGEYYKCRVELKADDEIEQGRTLMLYRALLNEGRVSWKTALVKGLGMTEAEADEEIDEALAEAAYRNNPIIADMVIREAVERQGGQRYLQQLQGQPLMPGGLIPERRGEPRSFTGNPESREAVRQMMGEAGGTIRTQPQMGGRE